MVGRILLYDFVRAVASSFNGNEYPGLDLISSGGAIGIIYLSQIAGVLGVRIANYLRSVSLLSRSVQEVVFQMRPRLDFTEPDRLARVPQTLNGMR